MKKFIFIMALVAGSLSFANGQIADHALGLRFAGSSGFGTEISYQHGLSSLNRLEFDLGFRNSNHYDGWGVSGTYQWVWNLQGDFNWYAGAGAKLGSWSNISTSSSRESGMFLGAVGTIGVEYVFPIGLQLAIDARPEIGLINHGSWIDLGLAVRYQF